MAFQPVTIAPFATGLDTDLEPWIAPPDSFTILDNCHVHHGYIEKRSGRRVFGQMQGMSNSIAITGISQADPGVVTVGSTAGLTDGDTIYISGVNGMTQVNDGLFTIASVTATTFELEGTNTTSYTAYVSNGTLQLVSDSSDRVMGIYRYIQSDNSQIVLAFNTTRANRYDGVTSSFIPLDSAPIMSGDATHYIWACQWQSSGIPNRLYFTNGKAYDGSSLDGIRYYDASGTGNTTVSFVPDLGGGNSLYGSQLLFVLRQRLIALNTFENDGATTSQFPQRARWCQAQGPSNWNDLIAGGGGFVDAPTGDQIISARNLQDQIIVFFTNSIWTLRPVSDPALPYRWDKLNDFRACDGKMASIGYDRYVVGLGVRGITATDGVQTERVDNRIEDFTNSEINTDSFSKVFCLRSYTNRRWWTLYPGIESTENDSALIHDDESKAYSTYSINLNCLGYGNFAKDYALSDFVAANDLDISIEDGGEDTILDYFWQDNQEAFLGGDITGTIFVLDTDGDDNGTEIESTLFTAQWNPFKDQGIQAQLSYIDFYVDTNQKTTMLVDFYKDDMDSPYASQNIDFLPNLNFQCTIQNISTANPCNVNAAQHGLTTGMQIYIYGALGMLQINDRPYTITVIDENNFTLNGIDSSAFGVYTGAGQVVLRAFYKTKTWKRAYGGGIGYGHRVKLSSSGVDCPFRISAIKTYFKPRGKRTVN